MFVHCFSISEMVEGKMETKNQIDELKAVMKNTRAKWKDEGLDPVPKEELLTFELLETYRRIVRQQLWHFQ